MKRILFSIVCSSLVYTCFAEAEASGKNAQLFKFAKGGNLQAVRTVLAESVAAGDKEQHHYQLFSDSERRFISIMLFLALPIIAVGISKILSGKHSLVGKPSSIQFYDKIGNEIPIDSFKGYIVVVNAWATIEDLQLINFYQTKHDKIFTDSRVKSLLLYVGNSIDKITQDIENKNLIIPAPFLVDIDNQFEEHFEEDRLLGGLVIDDKGSVCSVPRDRFFYAPFDYTYKTIEKLLRENKITVSNKNQQMYFAETNHESNRFIVQSGKWIQLAVKGCLSGTQMAIANGGEVNLKDNYGHTVLLIATEKGYTEIIKLLLKNGADINATRTDNDATPLHVASEKGYTEIVRLLLENGADINKRCKYSLDRLDWAKKQGQNIVKIVQNNNNGFSAIHLAAKYGHTEIINLLLEKGVHVDNKTTEAGETALYFAAACGHTKIVNLLLEKGADVNIKSEFLETTALQCACNHEIKQLLINAGAKQ